MPTRLIELVENLPAANVALVGDFMLDRYIFGSTERISPEAPIPVLKYQRDEWRLGGAGFVLAGLAALGAKVTPVGLVGSDVEGQKLQAELTRAGAADGFIVRTGSRPTVTKTRYLGSSEDHTPHQMLRLDVEDPAPADAALEREIIANGTRAIERADVLCLEDYNKGVLTPTVCRELIAAARARGIPIVVDPARVEDYGKYTGATLLKPNRPEAERAAGVAARSPDGVRVAAERLLERLDLDAVAITLNEKGAYLATRAGEREMLTSRSRAVADGTGAGDMVLVALCMAAAARAPWHEAVALANVVGGLEVEKLGCVPITREEIIHDLLAEHTESTGKVRTLAQLLPELARHRAAGRRVVFTNGCFDLIHLGHVKYFQFAKAQGDLLVVGVNTDAGIRRLKGDKRPIVSADDRCSVLEELESIDYLVTFDEDTPIELIRKVDPHVLVKGADYAKEQVIGWDHVESRGGRVALAPLVSGRSTTSVIQRILDAYGAEGHG